MTCPANVPATMCDLWQETEHPDCRGCEENNTGFMAKSERDELLAGHGAVFNRERSYKQEFVSASEDIKIEDNNHVLVPKKEKICERVGCTSKMYKWGMCKSHYKSIRKTENSNEKTYRKVPQDGCGRGKYARPVNNAKCKRKDCQAKHYSKGYCSKHYQQFKSGRLDKKKLHEFCTSDDCNEKTVKGAYCTKHYDAAKYQRRKARKIIHVRNGEVVE